MNKRYKKEYDNIKLTDVQKKTLIQAMKSEEKFVYEIEKQDYKFSKYLFRTVAACMALIIIATGTFIGAKFSKKPIEINPKNSFIITANAAETEKLPEDTICMFSGMSESGFMLKDNYFKDTYFTIYELTGLTVQGANIEKITVTSNKKFCYFNIPDKENFSDYGTLTNSQYTMEELTIDGVNCDSFTYTNLFPSEKEQAIDLGKMIEFIIESDNADKEMIAWLDEADRLQDKMWEIRAEQRKIRGDYGKITDEQIALDNEYEYCIRRYVEKTLRNATITVTITFIDGTTQTQELDIDFIIRDFDGNTIFDPRTNAPEELDMKTTDGYDWIAFRYAKQK